MEFFSFNLRYLSKNVPKNCSNEKNHACFPDIFTDPELK